MDNPFKRRRFYSEHLRPDTSRDQPSHQIRADFTLPDSPKISNLKLIEEIDDIQLDEGDIFSDFLGVDEPIDKASFFNELINSGDPHEDSFEREIASRRKGSEKAPENDLFEPVEPSREQVGDVALDKRGTMEMGGRPGESQRGKKEKAHADKQTRVNSRGETEPVWGRAMGITCPEKKKMIEEMFSFKVDVQRKYFGNRMRSQSYSIGQTNSIFDFLNKK